MNFALTGSEGDLDLMAADDPRLHGKVAASVWYLLKAGKLACVRGLEEAEKDPRVIACVQRLFEGDEILPSWVGTEQQVMLRLFLVCDSKRELAEAITEVQQKIRAYDVSGNEMLLRGFDAFDALEV